MPGKTRFDIESDNFNNYFASQVKLMTPAQRELLPKDVVYKLFRNGAANTLKNSSNLTFISKIFILWKAFKKRWFIVVESDDNEGMSPEQFASFSRSIKVQDYGVDRSKELISTGMFVTATKELADTLDYLNKLSNSPMYNYLTKIKNSPTGDVSKNIERSKSLVRFIIAYENSKKRITNQRLLNPPETYVLLGLFAFGEQPGVKLYRETFKFCYQSSATKMKVALSTLQIKGFIVKTGDKTGAKFHITPLGTELVNELISKYWVNF